MCVHICPSEWQYDTAKLWRCLPCNSATCHNWTHCYGNGNSLWYTWSLLHNLATCLSSVLATLAHAFKLRMLTELQTVILLHHTAHGLIFWFISITTCCPADLHPLATSTDNTLQFSGANLLLYLTDSVRYLPFNSTTSLCNLNCTFAKWSCTGQFL